MMKSHYGWGVATMVFNQLGQKARESTIKKKKIRKKTQLGQKARESTIKIIFLKKPN